MSKLKLAISFTKLLFSNTSEVLKNLYNFTEETRCKNLVTKKRQLPKGVPTVDLLDLLPNLNEKIENYSFLEGTSRITDIALLKALCRSYSNCQYIEFGTWRGESLYNVAQVAEQVYSISFSEKEMHQAGMSASAVRSSRFFSKDLNNLHSIEHNSQTYDFSALAKKFDVIFVDADHKYEGVKKDTESAFKLLKDENSVIVWHDSGRGLEELVNWQVQAGILDGAPDEASRKKIYRISNSLCAIYTNKKINASYPEPFYPNKSFELTISAKKISKQ